MLTQGRRIVLLAAAALAAIAMLAGCGYHGSLGDLQCDTDADCPGNDYCLDNYCINNPCDGELFECGGECVDLTSHNAHCGECDNRCRGGTPNCFDGECRLRPDCGSEKHACDTSGDDEAPLYECLDTSANDDYCGSNCDTCRDGTICEQGDCVCAVGYQECAGDCIPESEECDDVCDPEDCGPNEMCIDGECACPDEENLRDCDGVCVDTSSNNDHCGECANTCGDLEVCNEGVCVEDCPGDDTLCGGECVDTSSNDDHCGECANSCSTGQFCENGSCVCDTQQDYHNCDGNPDTCTNVVSNSDHCGMCGNPCGDLQVCDGDTCEDDCSGGQQVCDGGCVDITQHPAHCGGCNQSCVDEPDIPENADEIFCSNSTCGYVCGEDHQGCPIEGEYVCVDITTDEHCGGCGNECTTDIEDADAVCIDVVGDYQCVVNCPDSQTLCEATGEESVCVESLDTAEHCGFCFNACSADEECVDGECESEDESECDPNDTDPQLSDDGVYLLCAPEQVNNIPDGADGDYEIYTGMTDAAISFDDVAFEGPIQNFTGTFNGNGKTLANIDIEGDANVGIFATLEAESTDAAPTVSNLVVQDITVSGGQNVGALAGQNNGVIENVRVIGDTVEGDDQYIGGLVGTNAGQINSAVVTAVVDGQNEADGIGAMVGENSGNISNSRADGDVVDAGDDTGGFVGVMSGGTIEQSAATGDVAGASLVGGFVGDFDGGTIANCYATGDVDGTDKVAGFVAECGGNVTLGTSYAYGAAQGGQGAGFAADAPGIGASDSFWNDDANDGDDSNAQPLTEEEFGEQTSFEDDFDFDTVWDMTNTRPVLQWETSQ